jgi:hypothetical protein
MLTEVTTEGIRSWDRVYLSTDGLNLRPKGAPTKLLPRRIGPYEIREKFSGLNYKINIPEKWKTHPVFHVSRLELALEDQDPERSKKPEPLVFLDGEGEEEQEYQISLVVEHRLIRGRKDAKKAENLRFRVNWKGYGPEADTWESYQELQGTVSFENYCDQHDIKYEKKKLPDSGRSKRNIEDNVQASRGECNDPIVTKWGNSQIPIQPKRIRADVSNSH